MMKLATAPVLDDAPQASGERYIAAIPRVSVLAFC
jgi:hypothetical protein